MMRHTTATMNLGRLLSDTARLWPDRPALIRGHREWTWAELDARVNAAVAGLRALGVRPGDRILVQAKNGEPMFATPWIAWKLGAVWVPTNHRLTPPEIAYMAEMSGAVAAVYAPEFAAHLDAARAAAPSLRHVVALGEPRAGEHGFEELIAANMGAEAYESEVHRDDPCWFFFTSGTTGRPKAAVLTHGQLTFVTVNHLADLMPGLSPTDTSLVVAPLSHGAGAHMLSQVARGAASVLPESDHLDPEEVWRLVERHRVANMFTVPTIVKRLVEHPAVDAHDHGSLRHVVYAGAPMYRADQVLALEKLGPVLVQYYGLGEVTGNITVLRPDMHSLDDNAPGVGSVGVPRTGMEIAIRDRDGRRLGPGEQGEVCIRGPAVFAGYYENDEANAKAFRDGWFHTGDLGVIDVAGFLTLTGRASDMYISGGSNVYPREIEEVFLTHPAISEVAVLGVPHPDWGEAGVAVIVAEPGHAVEAETLLGFLDGKLAKYKWPRRVVVWDDLPKSGYGKVPKHLIRDELFRRGDVTEGEAL